VSADALASTRRRERDAWTVSLASAANRELGYAGLLVVGERVARYRVGRHDRSSTEGSRRGTYYLRNVRDREQPAFAS
jgi:hypothetical protein